ncbi:mycothiol synthase [Actinocorallia herbida]|uniref:Mycothiol synthase n=1 Tax=Actinocorallia herbida TaxID=58109 RepID=A0A3N1CVI3_9ACTN|nr:hypothetical protein [Actinocorallia herbida]ROO85302.1 mycothiol synthase [Actinocorallia herbida]
MIGAAWRARLDGEDLKEALELVRICAEFDAEAGFTGVTEEAGTGPGPHLLVRRDADASLVAYACFTTEDGMTDGRFVVHPGFRSIGIATTLLELLGPDAASWPVPGPVGGWADGHHPAAERLARRFALPETGRVWRTLRPLTGPHARPLPEPPSALTLTEAPAPGEAVRLWEESGLPARYRPPVDGSARLLFAAGPGGGLVGYAWLDRRLRRVEGLRTGTLKAIVPAARGRGTGLALASGALALLRADGARAAEARVDPALSRVVRMSRLLGFERTQDDVRYGLNMGI